MLSSSYLTRELNKKSGYELNQNKNESTQLIVTIASYL